MKIGAAHYEKVGAGKPGFKHADDPKFKMRPPVLVRLNKRVDAPGWSAKLLDLGQMVGMAG